MPTFTTLDGTELAYHVAGEGEPLLCLPGGPMRASAYLGDLGGLSTRHQLIMLDLRGTGDSGIPTDPATYRCDRQVADVEALRDHLGLGRVDVLAHSAGGDLAILYAAAHPQHIRTLTLITARARALGVGFTEEHRREVVPLRMAEPWFQSAHHAYERVWAGPATATEADFDAAAPFFYGRWDAAAQTHAASEVEQTNAEAADVYASPGAFNPAAARAAVASLDARVLILAGEVDSGPLPRVAAAIAELFPKAELIIQPDAGHFPWLDDPLRFTQTVATFLTQELHIEQPDSDAKFEDWQYVHNAIIPTHILSLEEIRERATRHHLEVAYLGDDLVGCSTVRPPTDDTSTATVIARVLATHRGRGIGEELYVRGLTRARELGAEVIETVVLSSNVDGLLFAQKHGFVETERYLLPGETIPWITLRLP